MGNETVSMSPQNFLGKKERLQYGSVCKPPQHQSFQDVESQQNSNYLLIDKDVVYFSSLMSSDGGDRNSFHLTKVGEWARDNEAISEKDKASG
jgi:hypothetical protein